MFSKSLEGAVVERVYYTTSVHTWLPAIGKEYESFADAKAVVQADLVEAGSITEGLVETRMVFRTHDGGTWDTPVDRTKVYR